MGCKLDGQDVTIEYQLGGVQDCDPTWGGTWIPLMALISGTTTDLVAEFSISEQSTTRQTRGIKGKRELTRVIAGKDTLTGTIHATKAAGPIFLGLRGYYCKFRITFVDTLSIATHEGVLTTVNTNITDGTLTQNITLECDAE